MSVDGRAETFVAPDVRIVTPEDVQPTDTGQINVQVQIDEELVTRKLPAVPVRVIGEGVDPAKLGTLTRDDGATQVSYDGHPLYRYSGDTTAGQVTGVGIEEWSPVGPDGPIT